MAVQTGASLLCLQPTCPPAGSLVCCSGASGIPDQAGRVQQNDAARASALPWSTLSVPAHRQQLNAAVTSWSCSTLRCKANPPCTQLGKHPQSGKGLKVPLMYRWPCTTMLPSQQRSTQPKWLEAQPWATRRACTSCSTSIRRQMPPVLMLVLMHDQARQGHALHRSGGKRKSKQGRRLSNDLLVSRTCSSAVRVSQP